MRSKGFAVESVCAVLREQGCQVAARTYRAWRSDPAPAVRTVSDAVLVDALCATAGHPQSLCGRRTMTAHLRRRGHRVAHCTVDRLMRQEGMNGVIRARSHRTTVPGKDGSRAGGLLDRDSTAPAPAPAPDLVWVADFTYVRTWAGSEYVAFAVDVFSEKTVGWHARSTEVTDLVLTCLRMATWRRGHEGHPVDAGSVHRCGAGSQDTSLRFTEHLVLEGLAPSIGSVGDAWDNALMDSVIGLFEAEGIRRGPFHSGPFKTVGDVECATATWVEWWNNARLHSTLRHVTPAEHEHAHHVAIAASPPVPRPV